MATNSLVSLFDSQKETLEKQLKGMLLPRDSEKIQKVVIDYLQTLFDGDGDFRMSLTQAEDYILNAALSLLNAQQEISRALILQSEIYSITNQEAESSSEKLFDKDRPQFSTGNPFLTTKTNAAGSLIGAGGGALIGQMLVGGWGSVFGAIAGTAITIYLSNYKSCQDTKAHDKTRPLSVKSDSPLNNSHSIDINIEQFISITRKICESVDNLIDTFRAQIRRVVNKYESQEKPSLEKEYLPLLEELQSLIGYKRAHLDDEKFVKKISERIEDVVETIENYNLSVVNYDGCNDALFINVPSPNTEITKQVFPAVTKNGNIVLKGKLFVPENQ